jgi:hypothetical protein
MVFNVTFNKNFSYIVAVIGDGNRIALRKSLTWSKSLKNFIT